MFSLMRAEVIKQGRRRLNQVILGVPVGMVLIISIIYGLTRSAPAGARPGLDIGNLLRFSPLMLSQLGLILAVVVAAGAVGSEFSYGTIKMMALREPARAKFLLVKFGTVLAMLVLSLLAMLAMSLAVAGVLALLGRVDLAWSTADAHYWAAFTKGSGASILLLLVSSGLAFMVSVLWRSLVAGVVAGMAYTIVDQIVGSMAGAAVSRPEQFQGGLSWLGSLLRFVHPLLISANGSAIMRLMPAQAGGEEGSAGATLLPATQAVLVLAAYLVVFMLVTLLVYRKRDITT